MSETGGDILGPGEGATGAPEQLSEEAKQRFAAAGAAMKALQREEKKSRKRDDKVARTIVQFLNDDRYAHLFLLISRLVARDCPSIFILAILSLINEDATTVVEEHLKESTPVNSSTAIPDGMQLMKGGHLDSASSGALIEWIIRMQRVMAIDAKAVLQRLMLDEHNIDGTVLQLATFIVQEFFRSEIGGKREVQFEQLHILTGNILQTVFEPFMDQYEKKAIEAPKDED